MENHPDFRKTTRIERIIETECKTCYVNNEMKKVDPPIKLKILNLSDEGVNILSATPLELNSTLIFDIDFGLNTYKVMAQVKWTKDNAPNFISGLEFTSVPFGLKNDIEAIKNLL